ncbi:MAG: cupredoxin domain-containing protein [Dehalococcoidia bacterium]
MYRTTLWLAALAGLLTFEAVGAAACGDDDDDYTGPPPGAATASPPPAGTSPQPSALASASTVEVAIDNRTFSPRRFTLKAGAPATITIKNNDAEAHNFTIQNGPTSGTVQGKTSGKLEFTPERGGLAFLCTIHGTAMSGTIVVE